MFTIFRNDKVVLIKEFDEIMKNNKSDSDEYQKAHTNKSKYLTDLNKLMFNTGIDYSILDELNRIMKYIYIYIYMV